MKDFKLQSLKSHDCHILMQQFLAIAIRSVLLKHVKEAVIRLCFVFNLLCSNVFNVTTLNKLEADHVVTLCLKKKNFLPLFLTL